MLMKEVRAATEAPDCVGCVVSTFADSLGLSPCG